MRPVESLGNEIGPLWEVEARKDEALNVTRRLNDKERKKRGPRWDSRYQDSKDQGNWRLEIR